jgi:hypothetical protein
MNTYKFLFAVTILTIFFIWGCDKKPEQPETTFDQKETSANKEKELQTKEEMLNLREKEINEKDKNLNHIIDSVVAARTGQVSQTQTAPDTTKSKTDKKSKDAKEKNKEKEKELNKRLDNPKVAVNDYLEYVKRAFEGNFDENMKKASQQWENRPLATFKSNYKNTKKFIVTEEPQVVSQKGNEASVKVKVKQTDNVNGKDVDKQMTITYKLSADKNGKWKIKSNIVQ